jgi:hypothetical protein
MFIISRLCFPKGRHWCPGVAWLSQWSVVAVWSFRLNEVAAAGRRRGGPTKLKRNTVYTPVEVYLVWQ